MENQNISTTNRVDITGTAVSGPEFSHESGGKRFHRMVIENTRLSGATDRVPVILPESLVNNAVLNRGGMHVRGEIRSAGILEHGMFVRKRYIFARSITEAAEGMNNAEVCGAVVRVSAPRRSASGKEFADMVVSVPAHGGSWQHIHVWGRDAARVQGFAEGTLVRVFARVQGRTAKDGSPYPALDAYRTETVS